MIQKISAYYGLAFVVVTVMFIADHVYGHGRLIDPPSRASAWRFGFPTPKDYDDTAQFCGGFARQWKKNHGKCGECGDAWDMATPRPHEFGGKFGTGLIVKKYRSGEVIDIGIQLTASHLGYFEFRVCENPEAKQSCLDKHLLEILGGKPGEPKPTDLKTRFYIRAGPKTYRIRAQLPKGFNCKKCVLQWRYRGGNNWGKCEDGTSALGCGPQEEFRACADISIGDNVYLFDLLSAKSTKFNIYKHYAFLRQSKYEKQEYYTNGEEELTFKKSEIIA